MLRTRIDPMKPAEFRRIRRRLKLTQAELAWVLGYTRLRQTVDKFERETISRREIPPPIARLMRAYASGYRPEDWPHRSAS
jgi:DNA-binding transcriptional regulator YiaG